MIKNIVGNKKLIISHQADIDGAGSVILARKYFGNKIDYILAENKDLLNIFKSLGNDYEVIYVCDLSFFQEVITFLEENPEIAKKIKHFDHHESTLKKVIPFFINCHIYLNNRKTCGTELFYQYLLSLDNSSFINNSFYQELVEAIRENDNWDVKENYNLPSYLAILFDAIGVVPFINLILSLDDKRDFKLPDVYLDIISALERKTLEYISNSEEHLLVTNYLNYKMGVVINEQYRSKLGGDICLHHKELDFIMIINFNRFTCSLRTVRDDIDLGLIAANFEHNGGGHKKAAGFTLNQESIAKITPYIIEYLNNLK